MGQDKGHRYPTSDNVKRGPAIHENPIRKSKVKVLPAPMVHRVAPIFVSVALGHMPATAVKATVEAGPLVRRQ